jgi:hypothetical protein
MDCAQFGEIVHDLDRPGTVGFALRESALAHAESCSLCGILVMESESLDIALRTLASRKASQQAPPGLAAMLMGEFQHRKFASLGRRVRRQIAALGSAAAVFLAVGLLLHFWHSGAPTDVVPGHGSARIAPSPATPLANTNSEQPSTPLTSGSNHSVPPESSGPSDASAVRASQLAEFESDAQFVRLPYADDPGGLDNDMVVRVMLTPATLASFGLPVTGIGSNEPVQADLAVSQDGTPQAVRLVSEANMSREF